MTKIIALAAAAALSVGLGVTVSGAANADGVRPTAKEIKSALTGFTRTMVNSRGFPMTF